jgi:hypothetical protein
MGEVHDMWDLNSLSSHHSLLAVSGTHLTFQLPFSSSKIFINSNILNSILSILWQEQAQQSLAS